MAQIFREIEYDVVVVGGGSAGIGAAVGAARNGARTLLIDAGPMVGGELLSGIPIDGCLNTRGEWIVGGVLRELLDECDRLGGYVGHMFDWRTIWVVCCDPEIMKIACVNLLRRHKIEVLLYSFVEDAVVRDGRVTGVTMVNKSGRTLVRAKMFIDCSGDADLAACAGVPFISGGENGVFQPLTMVFRMQGVETQPLLDFVRDHPENVAVKENPIITQSRDECIAGLVRQGFPKVFISPKGPVLGGAIARGEMYPTSLVALTPVSLARKEVSINSTRVANVDATRTAALSGAMPELLDQVWMCAGFLKRHIPGFERAAFAGIAPRIGIRETRRIEGRETLTIQDVLGARKRPDGVAKGGHHVDVHGSGSDQLRQPIRDGGSYDIPLGCLMPRDFSNLLVAGRCLSASREAHGSARVMGTCLAMGQAVGTTAALALTQNEMPDAGKVGIASLRDVLHRQGAILDGTH